MKSKFAAFALLFATVFALASCLSSNDDYTYTDDSAITSFSVSSGKQYVHIKSSAGADSVVTKEITLSSYKFYIDQVKCEIYNPDSLPCGVDAKKLLCSVSSGNSGTVVIKSMTSDSLSFFSTSDSLDFSVERQLQVYSNSALGIRKYTVKVNVHTEAPDSFVWHAKPDCEALKSLVGVNTVALGEKILLFGSNGTNTLVFTNNGGSWAAAPQPQALPADAYRSVVVKDNKAYISNGGKIMATTDGVNWTTTGTATGITRLVAASRFRLYGYAADGRLMASSDNGNSWTVSTIDDDMNLLPTNETTYVSMAVNSNALTDRVLLIGTRDNSQYPSDKYLTVWSKIDEGANNSENQPWAYYDVTRDNKHTSPLMTDIHAVAYDDGVFVLGTKAGAEGLPTLYKTRDNGITWNVDTVLAVPATFNDGLALSTGKTAYSIVADSSNRLWLVNAKNGKIWCGRINRLGWKKEQTEYTE